MRLKWMPPVLLMLVTLSSCANNPPVSASARAAPTETDGSVLFWDQQRRIEGFRNMDRLNRARAIDPGTSFVPLIEAPRDYSGVAYEIDGTRFSLDDFLQSHFVTGLLVVKGDQILLERYRLGHDAASRWVSFSIAKSVTSLLIGAAIRDGYIASVDESVTDYLPRLKNSPYDGASIRNVLQMASGIAWNEDYADPESDAARAGGLNGIALVEYIRKLPLEAEPGTRFNYNTGETNLVGAVLRAAIGNNAATYLSEKIWQPYMRDPATWSLGSGVELGGCCINATLRDYARIGLFAVANGVLPDGTRVLPDSWMRESTTPSATAPYYGYLWWLRGSGRYAALGIFGQTIWVDPAEQVVVVMHSAWPAATGEAMSRHRAALIDALYLRALESGD